MEIPPGNLAQASQPYPALRYGVGEQRESADHRIGMCGSVSEGSIRGDAVEEGGPEQARGNPGVEAGITEVAGALDQAEDAIVVNCLMEGSGLVGGALEMAGREVEVDMDYATPADLLTDTGISWVTSGKAYTEPWEASGSDAEELGPMRHGPTSDGVLGDRVYCGCEANHVTSCRCSDLLEKGVQVSADCYQGICKCTYTLDGAPTDLLPCRWASILFTKGQGYINSAYVWQGICEGFKVVDETCDASYQCENYSSITTGSARDQMTAKLLEELAEGKVQEVAYTPRCIHALGAVPKPDGSIRPITDCSRPEGISINNWMETTAKTFTYNSVDTVAKLVHQGDYLCVVDIKNAYRSVSIHPSHRDFQGLRWTFEQGPVTMVNNRLCFGCKCGPYIFDSISNVIAEVAQSQMQGYVVNYLDDFVIVAESEEACTEARDTLVNLLLFLGFKVAWNKIHPPAKATQFLGIIIDSEKMELRLPEGKLIRVQQQLEELQTRQTITKKELERAAGLLAHCSTVVRGGRTFCRRIYDACKGAPRKGAIPIDPPPAGRSGLVVQIL